MSKGDRVTISRPEWARRKGIKNIPWLLSINGRVMGTAKNKEEAQKKQAEFREQLKVLNKKRY